MSDMQSSARVAEHNLLAQQQGNEQSLMLGTVAAAAAALVGAVAWAGVTAATGYQIGWMAIGIGFVVGMAMRFVGKGNTAVFGVIGAALALLGCAVGNLFTIVWFVADAEGMALTAVLGQLNVATITELMTVTFDPMDVLFYALAAYCGYQFGFEHNVPAETAEA